LSPAEVGIPERELASHQNRSEDCAFRYVNAGDVSNVEALPAGEHIDPEQEHDEGQERDGKAVG
jgi:hypothetical protein